MEKEPHQVAQTAASEQRVSAIVVAYSIKWPRSGQAPLDLCLRSALAENWVEEVIVVDVDNAPSVSSALRALQADRRDVRVIRAETGASLAAAANLGAKHARGRWLLFLSPDVVLQRGAAMRLANACAGDALDGPWIAGGRLTDLEGHDRCDVRKGSLNAFSSVAVALDWRARKPAPRRRGGPAKVAAVSGAFMLIPRRDFETLGCFDAAFATHAADLDLCLRAAQAGGNVFFHPAAAGVQFETTKEKLREAQGLALFAAKSAKTPLERAFAWFARPALMTLVGLRDAIAGRPPQSKR